MSEERDPNSVVAVPKITTSRLLKLAEPIVTSYVPWASAIFKTYKAFKNDPELQEFAKECNDYMIDQYNKKSPIIKDSIVSVKSWSFLSFRWSTAKATTSSFSEEKTGQSVPENLENVTICSAKSLEPTCSTIWADFNDFNHSIQTKIWKR
uniref:Uncharacterized protein n=1 Tax=Panagrolaimus sp. JU765 TaxID=591449 RepID=A0AC34RRV1_9BILA